MRVVRKALGLQDPNKSLEQSVRSQKLDPTVLGWLKEVSPSRPQLTQYFVGLFPFLQWIKHYNVSWLIGDLVAGMYSTYS